MKKNPLKIFKIFFYAIKRKKYYKKFFWDYAKCKDKKLILLAKNYKKHFNVKYVFMLKLKLLTGTVK